MSDIKKLTDFAKSELEHEVWRKQDYSEYYHLNHTLITTIESQQTQISGYKDVYHNEWLKQSAEKDALIESQKEEIAKLRYQNAEWGAAHETLETQFKSQEAIKELAVKGLREIRDHKVHSYASSYQLIGMAQTTLEQIREVSHE